MKFSTQPIAPTSHPPAVRDRSPTRLGVVCRPVFRSLSGGVLSGIPSAAGAYTFTVTATDTNGCSGGTTYNVNRGHEDLHYSAAFISGRLQRLHGDIYGDGRGHDAVVLYLEPARQRGLGEHWTRAAGSSGGEFLDSSTDNENGGGVCKTFTSVNDLNSPGGNALGMFGGPVAKQSPAVSVR